MNMRTTPSPSDDYPLSSSTFCLQGGYEQALKDKPTVVKFPGMAGCSYLVSEYECTNEYQKYGNAAKENNPLTQFSSQMVWEVSRWAKLWGPGLTAFSELMSINRVSESLLSEKLL
jgi:hypothetical protein